MRQPNSLLKVLTGDHLQSSIDYPSASNIDAIGSISKDAILSISNATLHQQNWYSCRSGASVSVKYLYKGNLYTRQLWVKWVEKPKEFFESLTHIYNILTAQHLEDPVSKPYFYNEQQNLIFLEQIAGTSLLRMVLSYSLCLNLLPNLELPQIFFNIGSWLGRYHNAVATDKSTNLIALIQKIQSELSTNTYFNNKEKAAIYRIMDEIAHADISSRSFPLVKCHNDFTLRNLFLEEDGKFHIIDWDAMIHPKFPRESMGWWDLSTLFLNMQSMLKIHPILSKKRINTLCQALLQGYLQQSTNKISPDDYKKYIIYIITLKYYLGLDSDRPMYVIYKSNLGWLYIHKLHRALISGHVDLA